MASRAFERASSRVLPWLMQPGRLGASATMKPSSPGYNRTRRVMNLNCNQIQKGPSPKPFHFQHEPRQQRIATDNFWVFEKEQLLIRSVDVDSALQRIDQPTQ